MLSLNLDDVIKSDIPDPTRNKAVYLEISQMLPDELINLITLNAFGNGKRAYELIAENQEGDKALRVITAITDMQSIKMNPTETVATYLGRMDALRQQAKSLDVIPSEEYFVIGVIHGLPEKYTNLKTIVFSGPIPSYDAFKCQLTNYAAQLNMANEKPQTTVMNVNVKPVINKPKENNNYKKLNKNKPKCYKCLKIGHKANECRSKVFCKFCNNKSHHTNDCRNRNNPNTQPNRITSINMQEILTKAITPEIQTSITTPTEMIEITTDIIMATKTPAATMPHRPTITAEITAETAAPAGVRT